MVIIYLRNVPSYHNTICMALEIDYESLRAPFVRFEQPKHVEHNRHFPSTTARRK